MNRQIIAILLGTMITSIMLSGCGEGSETNVETTDGSVQNQEAGAAPSDSSEDNSVKGSGGKPWLDTSIKENITADTKADPKDDFYLYANKVWLEKNDIPDGYDTWSLYDKRSLDVKKQCMDLMKDESIKGHDAELVRTYNKLILDWNARNELGVSELLEKYNKITEAKNIDDITKLLTDKDTVYDYFDFFDFKVTTGLNDPNKYIVGVDTPKLLLKDSAEYTQRTELGDIYYGYYKDLFVYMAGKFGMTEDEANRCFENAVTLDSKLAPKIYTTKEKNAGDYYEKINNEIPLSELASYTKKFPLKEILTSAGYAYDGAYIVTTPDYFKHIDDIYTEGNLEAIKSRMIVEYILSYSSIVDKETYDKTIELDNKYLGSNGAMSDEEMACDMVKKNLPDSYQKVYIEKYGSEEDRQKMTELCQKVIDTYKELISENEWASDETKKAAIEKLDKMAIHSAYPDKFNDTTGIDIGGCTLIEAGRNIENNIIKENIKLIGTKVDKEKWGEIIPVTECNAFFNPQDNSINMFIGMMGEPFYSSDMSTEELYASIGAFWAGHEISHAFDRNGAQFDADGNFKDWMSDADKEQFQKRIDKMDKYLDSIVAFGDKHFEGANVDTEMTADITGLQCALKMASKVDGFDYKKFFTKYAQMNAIVASYNHELEKVSQDEHPLDYSRANVPVQQFEEFYKAFDVKEGDNMYLAPEDRITVW